MKMVITETTTAIKALLVGTDVSVGDIALLSLVDTTYGLTAYRLVVDATLVEKTGVLKPTTNPGSYAWKQMLIGVPPGIIFGYQKFANTYIFGMTDINGVNVDMWTSNYTRYMFITRPSL